MKTPTHQPFDLDTFYSAETIDEWKQIIGEDLHYHFGRFKGDEDLEAGLKQTVRHFYPHIPIGAKVLDVGCGWGGPAKLLQTERCCIVDGVTCSYAQTEYCRSLGLSVHHQDIETASYHFPEGYDVVFSLEMISHIRDKAQLLRKLRAAGTCLILSESCVADDYPAERETFGGSMLLCSVSELIRDVEAAGWTIQSIEDRRFSTLRTIMLWGNNLEQYYGDQQPPGQLSVLRNLVEAAKPSLLSWGRAFPLIDIVAN